MGQLIRLKSDEIRMEDLYLSFNLTAASQADPDNQFSYTGKEDFEVGMYTDGKAFGITNIEIDTALNMQPQVEITFKDLYGNLVFRNDSQNSSKYKKIFELPPPKFKLTFKGYLGLPITYTLQLRSTSVNYVTSDGSFEIKSKFVPNIFGFFGDIPFKYLFSVDKLRELRGSEPNPNSMLNIYKNGNVLNEEVQAASEQYEDLRKKLNLLLAGGTELNSAVEAGTLSSDGKTPWKVDAITPTDSNLGSADPPFKPITFNFINNGLKNPSGYSYEFGEAIKHSIVTNTPTIGTKGVNVTIGTWPRELKSLSGKTADINTLLQENLKALDSATNKSAGSRVQQEVLDSQTIGNVMNSLAGEAGYILGYIIEGALNGYKSDRENNENIIGKYYPLFYKENTTDGTNGQIMYDQIPWEQATVERKYVMDFMKAQYEGQQEAQKYKEEQEAKQNGTEGAINQGAELIKRITNAEAFKPNPYIPENADNLIVKMMQRAGIVHRRFSGPDGTDYGAVSKIEVANSEYQNIKKRITEFASLDKQNIIKFASRTTKFFDSSGKRLLNYDSAMESGSTTTYRQYYQSYFNRMKIGGLDESMFVDNNSARLACKYFINNDIIYYNEKDLQTAVGGKKNIYFYVPSDKAQLMSSNDVPTPDQTAQAQPESPSLLGSIFGSNEPEDQQQTPSVAEKLNGKSDDSTAPVTGKFFEFQNSKDFDFGGVNDPTILIDYNKLANGSFSKVSDLFIKMSKTAANGIRTPDDGSLIGKFLMLEDASTDSRGLVLNMEDQQMMATLHKWCTDILKDINAVDPEADKKKAEEEKNNGTNADGTSSGSETGNQPYTFDQAVYEAIYHQFHHIANAWLTTAKDSLGGGDINGIASSKKLAEELQQSYSSSTGTPDRPYKITFAYATQVATLSNSNLAKAIVNTTLLGETDTDSTVFSTMSNLAQQNNFLLQSIPGSTSDDASGSNFGIDVTRLFKPFTGNKGVEGNTLCFIWQPTPESRSLNNKGDFVYGNTQNLLQTISKMDGDFPVFEFGSPDNVFVKSIKATTDENKVTGESIAAVEDIISPNNQTKKRSFDCSMLSVMQGRSYKVGLEILGNANFIPTQRFVIDNIPIFSGLYWTSNVKHSITPNEMTTSIEAIKMKYDGQDKFISVGPVTTSNYKPDTTTTTTGGGSTGGGSSTTTENIITDGLNYEFIQRVKDEKMKNASDINAFIKKYDPEKKYSDYPSWFNAKVKGQPFCDAKIDATNWTHVWNTIIPYVWKDYGGQGINFLEFLCLNMIMYNETGGKYKPISENVNGINNGERPGIAYTFDRIPNAKKSYNKPANIEAGKLFNDPKFISRFQNLPFGNDPKVIRSKDSRWNGDAFPKDLFPNNIKDAANPNTATFINEADFFKYRGRGLIQTTWRGSYKKLVDFILQYNGSDQVLLNWKGKFRQAPYNGDPETILTVASNQDWDNIFQTSADLPAKAIQIHADGANGYQYFKDLTKSKTDLEGKVGYVAYRVSGTKGEYLERFSKRVYVQLDILSPSTKVTATNTNTNNGQSSYVPPPPPAASSAIQVTAIKTTLQKLFGGTATVNGKYKQPGAGEEGLCGVYTVSAAKSYTTFLKNPNASVEFGAYARGKGHAKDESVRSYLTSLGYTVVKAGSNLSKKELSQKISSTNWGLGDIVIYWATDTNVQADGHTKYGHIQIYQGKQYNNAQWATSVPDNYGGSLFVYGRRPNEKWEFYICRAPSA